jgi:uridine kinase
MKKMIFHPLFIIGLALRLILLNFIEPEPIIEWYVPFLDATTSNLTLDPWALWAESGGSLVAFPYGYAMWVIFLPITFFAKVVGFPILYAYYLTILLIDFCLLYALCQLVPNRKRLLLIVYWLSPILLLATYGYGLNDLIPVFFLCISILKIRNVELKLAGFFLGVAISTKLSMIIALPFFMIYLLNNKMLRTRLSAYIKGLTLSTILFLLPFIFSTSGIDMIIGNPEMGKIYELVVNLPGNVSLYVTPLFYLVAIYMTWRIKRINFDLFLATTGITLLLIVLITPASPGWFIWVLPFLVYYQSISDYKSSLLVGMFSFTFILNSLFVRELYFANGLTFSIVNLINISEQIFKFVSSLLYTSMLAIGLVLLIRMWRDAVGKNDFYRLSRKPFIIGIAGDSGSGKDTIVDSISGLFGEHSVAKLSGDDYHLWDRHKPMWQVMTHLNPMANKLEDFSNDLLSLTDGRSVISRQYNHETGQMSKPRKINSNNFIIASGLHALYSPALRNNYNLKIYLDINEELRRQFKIKRDVHERGHNIDRVLESFEKREHDSACFVRPQINYSDLIFSLQPMHPRMLKFEDQKKSHGLRLVVSTNKDFNIQSIHRILVGVCGLHVDIDTESDSRYFKMTIDGDVTSADISMAGDLLFSNIKDFLDFRPEWCDGELGLIQLITLCHISHILTKRFIS